MTDKRAGILALLAAINVLVLGAVFWLDEFRARLRLAVSGAGGCAGQRHRCWFGHIGFSGPSLGRPCGPESG